jgi:hypothetical protein
MKTIGLFFACFFAVVILNAQGIETGTWSIFEMSYVSVDETTTVPEEQIKSSGFVTDYFFMEEGKIRMTSNMSGSGTLDTYEGTWKTFGNDLIITLRLGERDVDVDYSWEMQGDVLILTRTSPDGNLSIVMSFRKK